MIELSRPFSPRAAKDSYGASSPIRRVVSHRLQSADSGHSGLIDPTRHQASAALRRTDRPACRRRRGAWRSCVAIRIDRDDLHLRQPVVPQQRHQLSRREQIGNDKRRAQPQSEASNGSCAQYRNAGRDQGRGHSRNHRITAGIKKGPVITKRGVGVKQAVVSGQVRRTARFRVFFKIGRCTAQYRVPLRKSSPDQRLVRRRYRHDRQVKPLPNEVDHRVAIAQIH